MDELAGSKVMRLGGVVEWCCNVMMLVALRALKALRGVGPYGQVPFSWLSSEPRLCACVI
jgi:hypothetical protein